MSEKSSGYLIGGILITILGSICFSAKAIFVKLAYVETTVDAVSLLALRMIFSIPFFLGSALITSSQKGNVKFTTKQWFYIAFIGCLGYYVSSLLDFLGLQYISAGMERLILFMYPTIVVLMSAAISKEKIKTKQWVALILTYSGLLLAFTGEVSLGSSDDPNFYLGCFLVFGCAVTFAAYIVGSGKLIPMVGPVKFNSYAMSFAAIGVLLHFFITSDKSLLYLDNKIYIFSFLMAIISTVIPSYLRSEGIKRIGPENASIVTSIGPASTIIQANIFLDEPIFALQIAGTVLILSGVMLISWKAKRNLA
ncbi:MAG TPA: EamA family transporter [Cytophagales bacterium]|nr:EamA family transporter [Cytophagales bacterium]